MGLKIIRKAQNREKRRKKELMFTSFCLLFYQVGCIIIIHMILVILDCSTFLKISRLLCTLSVLILFEGVGGYTSSISFYFSIKWAITWIPPSAWCCCRINSFKTLWESWEQWRFYTTVSVYTLKIKYAMSFPLIILSTSWNKRFVTHSECMTML